MAYDDERQRLPMYEDTDVYRRVFAGRRIPPDERRTRLAIPDDLGEQLDALAAEYIAQRRAFGPRGA